MQNLSKISKFQLTLMAVLLMFSLISAVLLFIGVGLDLSAAPEGTRGVISLYGIINLVDVVALACGIMYILNRYAKRVAMFYQAFLFLVLAQTLLHIYASGISSVIGLTGSIIPLTQVLMAVKVGILVLLVFAKDLGEKRTLVLVGIMMMLDVVCAVLTVNTTGVFFYRFITILSRLSFDVTILLSVLGKYADKERRGSR